MVQKRRQEHILVCLSSAPSNPRIIRTAATMAEAFHGSFTALFVRTPAYEAMERADQERLRENTQLARELGAAIETVFGEDVSYQIAEYARLSGVTKIVIGRSAIARKHPWSKPTLTEKLTAMAPELDIHIIPDAAASAAYRPGKEKRRLEPRRLLRDWGISLGILTAATALGFCFSGMGFTEANIIAVYLLGAVLTAMSTSARSSYVLSAVGSVVVFNFFFTHPQFSLRVYDRGYPVTFLIMLAAALLVGSLTERLKASARQSARAAYRTGLLFETNQLLQKAATEEDIFHAARTQITKLLDRDMAVYPGHVAQGAEQRLLYPIRVNERVYGFVTIDGSQGPLEAFENSVLLSILGECALALESSRNAREKEEAALQAENEKLRANLLRAISHDLRTPLTGISGYAGILLSSGETLDERVRRQMYTDIYDDAAWLSNLVENLLAVTRIDEGRMKLNMQPQLAEELVSEALAHASRRKAEHHVSVEHADEFLLVPCDARLMVQVLINLVDNAIKYTQPGSEILVRTRQAGTWAEFEVADNGPGIADGEKERIFQMFYTVGRPVADSRRSLGLGLSLCKSIVEAHGGGIRAEDNAPQGTKFLVTIPTREVDLHE